MRCVAPRSFYQSAAECGWCDSGRPSRGDGTFGCVAPQATTCTIEDFSDDGESNSSNKGNPCSYTFAGMTVNGICGDMSSTDDPSMVCFASCSASSLAQDSGIAPEVSCTNPNSLCMSDGFIGATDSVQYCIPNDYYSSIDICDEEYHAYDRGDGYFGCVAPSILPCNQADLADNGSADASVGMRAHLPVMG